MTSDGSGITFNGVTKEYVDAATVKALNLSDNDSEKWVKITEVTSSGEDPATSKPKAKQSLRLAERYI